MPFYKSLLVCNKHRKRVRTSEGKPSDLAAKPWWQAFRAGSGLGAICTWGRTCGMPRDNVRIFVVVNKIPKEIKILCKLKACVHLDSVIFNI